MPSPLLLTRRRDASKAAMLTPAPAKAQSPVGTSSMTPTNSNSTKEELFTPAPANTFHSRTLADITPEDASTLDASTTRRGVLLFEQYSSEAVWGPMPPFGRLSEAGMSETAEPQPLDPEDSASETIATGPGAASVRNSEANSSPSSSQHISPARQSATTAELIQCTESVSAPAIEVKPESPEIKQAVQTNPWVFNSHVTPALTLQAAAASPLDQTAGSFVAGPTMTSAAGFPFCPVVANLALSPTVPVQGTVQQYEQQQFQLQMYQQMQQQQLQQQRLQQQASLAAAAAMVAAADGPLSNVENGARVEPDQKWQRQPAKTTPARPTRAVAAATTPVSASESASIWSPRTQNGAMCLMNLGFLGTADNTGQGFANRRTPTRLSASVAARDGGSGAFVPSKRVLGSPMSSDKRHRPVKKHRDSKVTKSRRVSSGGTARAAAALREQTCYGSSETPISRLEYDPFLGCDKHDLCKLRAQLTTEELETGGHYVPAEKAGMSATPKFVYAQARLPGGGTFRRSGEIEDSDEGLANLMQLHLAQAFMHGSHDRRPLLLPNIALGKSPILRVLTSKRFYSGQFFDAHGGCQHDSCVLIVFPKNHRGDVRLQLKVWNTEKCRISSTSTKDDTKAHVLSYILWLFGLSEQVPSELGQFPPHLHSTCNFGRVNSDFRNPEFLCVNPSHYLPDDMSAEDLADRIEQRLTSCFKSMEALPGETPDPVTGRSKCFCLECRKNGFTPI